MGLGRSRIFRRNDPAHWFFHYGYSTHVSRPINQSNEGFMGLSFFLAMDEIVDDLIMPRMRSHSMNLHPVAIIFFLLIMGAAFGFIGVLLSTPVAAFAKSFYEEFYLTRLTNDERMEKRIESMIQEPRAQLKSQKKIKDKVDKQNSDLLIDMSN